MFSAPRHASIFALAALAVSPFAFDKAPRAPAPNWRQTPQASIVPESPDFAPMYLFKACARDKLSAYTQKNDSPNLSRWQWSSSTRFGRLRQETTVQVNYHTAETVTVKIIQTPFRVSMYNAARRAVLATDPIIEGHLRLGPAGEVTGSATETPRLWGVVRDLETVWGCFHLKARQLDTPKTGDAPEIARTPKTTPAVRRGAGLDAPGAG